VRATLLIASVKISPLSNNSQETHDVPVGFSSDILLGAFRYKRYVLIAFLLRYALCQDFALVSCVYICRMYYSCTFYSRHERSDLNNTGEMLYRDVPSMIVMGASLFPFAAYALPAPRPSPPYKLRRVCGSPCQVFEQEGRWSARQRWRVRPKTQVS
jgi:hypothetical protein